MPIAGEVENDGNYVSLQQRHEATLAVQGHQIVTAADVLVANEDLRHGTTTGERHHAVALFRLLVDADFFNVLHAPRLQELFGPNAIRANCGGEHLDWVHGAETGLVS
jgi:hypothetical protein